MHRLLLWLVPLLVMAIITPLTPYLDLTISGYFFDPTTQTFVSNGFVNFFYEYGEMPAMGVGIIAAIVLVLSFFFSSWKKFRIAALILVLTLVIGAGLIVNEGLKGHWGRPRPRQIVEFGGHTSFFPFYHPNFGQAEYHKSFPCGHCTMGFYFITFAVIGYRLHSRFLLYLGLIVGIGFGALLSICRVLQGGHFLSDTLMSALIMWLTALTMSWLIQEDK